MRYSAAALLPILVLLSACSSKPKTSAQPQTSGTPSGGFLLQPQHDVFMQTGDFAYNPEAEKFIDKMVNEHGFDRRQLHEVLSQAKRLDYVLRLMDQQAPTTAPPAGPNGAWLRYRAKFITPDNVQNGVKFWNQYEAALNRAYQVYGVPPEIIVGIIGVETRWGRVMGKTRIVDALATLAFAYPRRAQYFAGELETFLLMNCRARGTKPTGQKRGGAKGIFPFTSLRHSRAPDQSGADITALRQNGGSQQTANCRYYFNGRRAKRGLLRWAIMD